MPFSKVDEPKKRSSYVAEQILNSIADGEYSPGDRLPSERSIAEQMGVSRNSVREALSALQIVDVVETKAGSGTYITSEPDEVNVNEALARAREGEDLLEIWEARREVEISLAKLAVKRANADDLSRLKDIIDDMELAADKNDHDLYLEANESFHMAIANMARNRYLENALEALLEVTKEHVLQNMVEDYHRYMLKSIEAHRDILETIEEERLEQVTSVMTEHFLELEDYLKERLFKPGMS